MQGSPEILSVKRSRAKAKDATPTVPVRKSRRKIIAAQPPAAAVAAAQPAPADPTPLIATTAYFLAAERHFAPGHELDDWLEAERRVAMAGS